MPVTQQPDPWDALLSSLYKQALKTGVKQGASYLNNQFGLTDTLTDYVSSLLGLTGATPATAGTIGGLVPELAGPIGADLGIGLGTEAAGAAGTAAAASGATAAGEGTLSGILGGLSGGGGIPIAAALVILQSILTDELNDPKGRVSAAQDYNYLNSQSMPAWSKTLAQAHSALPFLNDNMSNAQAEETWKLMRTAAKNNQLMADPMANQGQNEFGVKLKNYGSDIANLRKTAGPESVLGTIRSQDILSRKGVQPKEFETATPLQVQLQRNREQTANQPGASGEYLSQYAGLPSLFNPQGNLAPLAPLRPDEALSMLGFHQANLAAPENTAQLMKAYGVTADNPMPDALKKAYAFAGSGQTPTRAIYTPDVMEELYKLQPGGWEQGLMNIVGNY